MVGKRICSSISPDRIEAGLAWWRPYPFERVFVGLVDESRVAVGKLLISESTVPPLWVIGALAAAIAWHRAKNRNRRPIPAVRRPITSVANQHSAAPCVD